MRQSSTTCRLLRNLSWILIEKGCETLKTFADLLSKAIIIAIVIKVEEQLCFYSSRTFCLRLRETCQHCIEQDGHYFWKLYQVYCAWLIKWVVNQLRLTFLIKIEKLVLSTHRFINCTRRRMCLAKRDFESIIIYTQEK